MREILFRGKTPEGEWVYGYYYANYCPPSSIMPLVCTILNNNGAHKVLPETVGQYVGVTDIPSAKLSVWEHDVIEAKRYTGCGDLANTKGILKYYKEGYFGVNEWYLDELKDIKVMGNLTDNPELLRGDK